MTMVVDWKGIPAGLSPTSSSLQSIHSYNETVWYVGRLKFPENGSVKSSKLWLIQKKFLENSHATAPFIIRQALGMKGITKGRREGLWYEGVIFIKFNQSRSAFHAAPVWTRKIFSLQILRDRTHQWGGGGKSLRSIPKLSKIRRPPHFRLLWWHSDIFGSFSKAPACHCCHTLEKCSSQYTEFYFENFGIVERMKSKCFRSINFRFDWNEMAHSFLVTQRTGTQPRRIFWQFWLHPKLIYPSSLTTSY